jgi:lysyl-tRNA synthetase class 1
MVNWAKGCSQRGKKSPFDGGGKMPWKVEWPARWKVLGVTVEGEGKDHSSRGGSRDIGNHLSQEVFDYEPPYDVAYEHFLYGGKKMSSSKGIGATAREVAQILPPQLLRFLMVRTKYMTAIDFDPGREETIPNLFDEYDRCKKAFYEKGEEDLAQSFKYSQIGKIDDGFLPRFSLLVSWAQLPNVDPIAEALKLKGKALTKNDEEGILERLKYAKIWLERFAPQEAKFSVATTLPREVKDLSSQQKELLKQIAIEVDSELEAQELQDKIYQIGQSYALSGAEIFQAVYISLLGKNHGPKAGWLIKSLEKSFVKKRFEEASFG